MSTFVEQFEDPDADPDGFTTPTILARRRRARVWLKNIDDWCIDYSYGTATMWIITKHAWYKVAGVNTGLRPARCFRESHSRAHLLYVACTRLGEVLQDLLPINKNMPFKTIVDEAVARCGLEGFGKEITEEFICSNHKFVAEQVKGMDTEETDGMYMESRFMQVRWEKKRGFCPVCCVCVGTSCVDKNVM